MSEFIAETLLLGNLFYFYNIQTTLFFLLDWVTLTLLAMLKLCFVIIYYNIIVKWVKYYNIIYVLPNYII